MSDDIRRLLTELKGRLERLYGARLKSLYLFGSYARGDADAESDVDVLIVLDHVNNYSHEIDFTGAVISELSLRYGVTISRVFANEDRWKTDQSNFFLNVREEAVAA